MNKRTNLKTARAVPDPMPEGRTGHVHHGGDDVSVGGGALPHGVASQPLETPDTQEALFAEDGVWEVSEADGNGPRHASVADMQIEADGLTVVDGPAIEGTD